MTAAYEFAEMIDDRSPFDAERDRINERHAKGYLSARDKADALREVDQAERAAERHDSRRYERAKDKRRGR